MKNKISGLRTATYKVGDIHAAKEWYTKVFETQAYFDEPYYVGFNIGGYELGLQTEGIPTNRSRMVMPLKACCKNQQALIYVGNKFWLFSIHQFAYVKIPIVH